MERLGAVARAGAGRNEVEPIESSDMGERKEEASDQLFLGFWLSGPVRPFVELR